MTKQPPAPITEENFPEFWAYTDHKLRRIKAAIVAERFASWIGNTVFAAGWLLVIYALLRLHPSSGFRAYLDGITFLKDWLDRASAIIMDPGLPGPVPAILILLGLFGIPFAVSCAVTVLVRLVYRPGKSETPVGSAAENSKLLLEKTKLVTVYANRISSSSSADLTFTGVFMIACCVLICGYIVQAFTTNDRELLTTLSMQVNPMTLTPPAMAVFFCYAAVNYIFIELLKAISYCSAEPSLQEEATRYHLECDPDEKARLDEEERILKLAKEIMERRMREHERLRNG